MPIRSLPVTSLLYSSPAFSDFLGEHRTSSFPPHVTTPAPFMAWQSKCHGKMEIGNSWISNLPLRVTPILTGYHFNELFWREMTIQEHSMQLHTDHNTARSIDNVETGQSWLGVERKVRYPTNPSFHHPTAFGV
ncbi:hypothetical protein AVEN_200717-1 [Araneus ventricosus]|uniref:Uncharacterized protein n=1 Tax=Araneus ventricosus TaxID=182803 RepID=A0A4Y2MX44_ARAVE|nr:hypothetical protein AVEN_71857-1 [Araneus ventricosus]GBN30486.1 hypothetical protein AVEN_143959-1 [Araneus ventricosus]GBN30523.1 hypothetical protein AVEN_198306-1 [Araneus ventricosus]GBN30528.1 hypothetical protein AVEN_200717-1 [Araneus ventricosus]